MEKREEFEKILKKTEIVKFPETNLFTFGATKIHYFFVAELKEKRVRVREGKVISERPQIIRPRQIREIFEGFGTEGGDYAEMLFRELGADIAILQYRFKNEAETSGVFQEKPEEVINKIKKDLEDKNILLSAIIKGLDSYWQVSLMKFISEITLKAVPGNIREMEEKGLLEEEEGVPQRVLWKINQLFKDARADRSKLPDLGKVLQKYGLFEKYEDQFWKLWKK